MSVLPVVVLFLAITGIMFYRRATAFIHSLFQFPNRNPNLSHHSLVAPLPSRFQIALHPEYRTMELTSSLVGEAGTRPTTIPPSIRRSSTTRTSPSTRTPPASSSRVALSPIMMCPKEAKDPRAHHCRLRHAPQKQIQDLTVDPDAPPQHPRGVLVIEYDVPPKRQWLDDITTEDSDMALPQQQAQHDNLTVDTSVPTQ
jgi:hypothetical protein